MFVSMELIKRAQHEPHPRKGKAQLDGNGRYHLSPPVFFFWEKNVKAIVFNLYLKKKLKIYDKFFNKMKCILFIYNCIKMFKF
jgi:hypothetical protein